MQALVHFLALMFRCAPALLRSHSEQVIFKPDTVVRMASKGIQALLAMDFFVVPTVTFRLLYVWFLIDHGRRRIIHANVTASPTASWVVQQLRESLPDDLAPNYVVFDNDTRRRSRKRLASSACPRSSQARYRRQSNRSVSHPSERHTEAHGKTGRQRAGWAHANANSSIT